MGVRVLTIHEDVLGTNKQKAVRNRERLNGHGILTVNIMSSPGAGKTSLILQTIDALKPKMRVAVIEGDVASSIDAEKVQQQGVPVIQINIPGGCHLDANMVGDALDNLPIDKLDLLLIENVGNLICPAQFALGERRKVMLLSVPEGDDKPEKYPLMFTEANVVLLNKIDLLPYLDFDVTAFSRVVTELNPNVKIFQVSCRTGEGLERWFSWLEKEMKPKEPESRNV